MSVTVKFTGIREIDNVLKNLPKALTHSVMSAAHTNAAKPLVARAKQIAPVGPTHNLVDSIGVVKSSVKRATEVGEIRVGPKRRKAPHAHLVEYGTRKRNKRGPNRGVMPKIPFMGPAFIQTKDQVLNGISTATAKTLLRTMKRYI